MKKTDCTPGGCLAGGGDSLLASVLDSVSDRPQMSIDAGFALAVLNLTREYWEPNFPAQSNLLDAWARTSFTLEYFLVANGGVPRIELLHKIIELKGAYGFPLLNEFVEAGLGRRISRKTAEKMGLLPLATSATRLYCLSAQDNDRLRPGEAMPYKGNLQVVPLGRVGNLTDLLDELYRNLEMHDASNRRLGEYLVQLGLLGGDQLKEALFAQRESGERLGAILIRQGWVSEAVFYEVLAALAELPYYRRTSDLIKLADANLACRLPRAYCERNMLIALHLEGGALWVATDEPKGLDKVSALSTVYHTDRIHLGVASPSSIRNAINSLYGDRDGSFNLDVAIRTVSRSDLPVEVVEIGSGIPKFLDFLLYEGIRRGPATSTSNATSGGSTSG